MLTVTQPYHDPKRRGIRRDVLLNDEPIGYILKDDGVDDELFNRKQGYVWRASAGGQMTCYHCEVGAIAKVIAIMSTHIAEAVVGVCPEVLPQSF